MRDGMRFGGLTALSVVVLGAAAWGQEAPAPPADNGARIELTPTEFDFGEVWEQTPVERVFTIRNTGSGPLTATVKSSCGCTPVDQPQSPLPPGETTTFTVRYDTSRFGAVHKTVTVASNDPTQSQLKIDVKGHVKPLFERSPAAFMRFEALERDAVATQTMTLTNKFGRPVALRLKPDQDFGPFEIALTEREPGRLYELTVTTRPPLKDGANKAAVKLDTDLSEVPTLPVAVWGMVEKRVYAAPPKLVVTPHNDKVQSRIVRVQYFIDRPIKILDVRLGDKPVSYQLRPPVKPTPGVRITNHVMDVEIPAYADVPPEGLKLVIRTDDEEAQFQRLEIAIERYVGPARSAAKPPLAQQANEADE